MPPSTIAAEIAWIGPRPFYEKAAGIVEDRRFVPIVKQLVLRSVSQRGCDTTDRHELSGVLSNTHAGSRVSRYVLRAIIVICMVTSAVAADPAIALDPIKLHGQLVDKTTHEPVVGATVVTASQATGDNVAITDDTGAFALEIEPAISTLTIYYNDAIYDIVVAASGATDMDAGAIEITTPPGAPLEIPPCQAGPPMAAPQTLFRTSAWQWPASRARDASSIGALAASAPAGQTTWLDGNRRLGGAPAIALGLLSQVEIYKMPSAGTLHDASDGIWLTTSGGANDNDGTARIALGTDGPELEAVTGGPIVVDAAWWWAGAVLGPDGQQELAKVNYAPAFDEQGAIVALHQSEPAAIAARARATIAAVTDDYGAADWLSKLDAGKLQIEGGATGERLDDGTLTTRGAIHARIERRQSLAGYHILRAYGELGAGDADGTRHRDASASVGDDWQLTWT